MADTTSSTADEADVLNKIHCAKKAEYRHGDGNGCLKGTRGPVLDAIEVWARDPDKPPVYWLNGVAGTGKTTIARTIAARIFADGQLGASFFCSRDFEDRRDIHSIFPTLAVQLARKYAQFRSVFVRLVRSDPEIAHESLFSQMRKLILEPLKESRISTVIVVDALDECKDEEPASAILSVIGQFVSEIPKVKFLITGRPEPRIQEGFRLPLLTEATDVLILHEVDLSQVENDIRLFFAHEFSELARRRRGLDGWPTKEQLDLLCKRAAGLFIYAVATVKFVDKRSANPIERLNLLLRSPEDNGREARTKYNENTTLDSLYISVLKGAFGDDDDPDDDPKVRSVLGTMILAANPISSSSIAMLLGLDADRDVFPLLSSAQSLLILQDVNCPVRSFHKSFPDFITNPERCTSQRFYVSPPHHHSQLLISCLDLLSRTLVKNMCKLPDGVANSDVNDLKERIERCIGPALRYACTSWHTHLTGGRAITTNTLEITSALHGFLEDKFLFWLEVLSVLGAVGNAVDALQAAADWLEVCRDPPSWCLIRKYLYLIQESPTLDLANDCFRFVIRHFEIINTSSPHIYHSALVLTPRESIIYRLYKPHAQPFVRVLHGIPVSWGPNTAATKSRFDIRAAVWSPCSRSIAISLWGTNRVDILDSATLQRLQSLEFPQKMSPCSQALAFSPDSRTLTSFIHDNSRLDPGFVISWDIQTGGVVSDIEWKEPHGAQAGNPQITYSMNGTVVAVLSRSESSTTISVYDIVSGVHMHDIDHRAGTNRDLPLGAPYAYKTWIHGESLRFVTPELTLITIWEVGFAPGATPMEVETISIPDENVAPFVSAQSDVTWVEFHPASCRLAFTDIDGTLLVWDVRASEFLLHHAGTGFDTFMTFSSDARFFACTTLELEVYLWKESPTGYMLLERLAPANQSSKPYLSPNGESILTCSDSMIRLWPTKGFTTSNGSTQALRHSENFLLEFIPNRQLAVITRREGKAVTVFDLESGILQLTINTSIKVYGLKVVENTIVVIGHKQVISWDLLGQSFLSGAVMNVEDSTQTIKFSNMDHYSIPVKSPLTNINHRRLGTKKSTPSDSG